MSKDKQDTGHDMLPNNFSAKPDKGGNSTAPKVSGAGGGNFTGPGFEGTDTANRNKRGERCLIR